MMALGKPSPSVSRAAVRSPPGARSRTAFRVGCVLLVVQLAGMVAFSTIEYRSYGMSLDFGGFAQAWAAIAHGHLDPWNSIFEVPFLHNNLDLALYLLAPLERIYPSPIVLSWAEDVVIAATGLVALLWAKDVVVAREDELGRVTGPMILGVAICLATNPWAWEAAAYPVHFETFAALFAVLAARALWKEKFHQLFVWVPLAVASEALGSMYVIGVGLAGLAAGRATRRPGAVLAVVGVLGLVGASHLGGIARGGTSLLFPYGYLLGPHPGAIGLGAILHGLVARPGAAFAAFTGNFVYLVGYVVAAGFIGLASPWGFFPALVILLPNALSHAGFLASFPAAFQSWPAEPFLVVAGASVAVRLCARARSDSSRATALSTAVIAVAFAACLVVAASVAPTLSRTWLIPARVTTAVAGAATKIPPHAEVAASAGIIGRLAIGRLAFVLGQSGPRIPIRGPSVYFLIWPLPGHARTLSYLESTLHARVVLDRAGVEEFRWTPALDISSIHIP